MPLISLPLTGPALSSLEAQKGKVPSLPLQRRGIWKGTAACGLNIIQVAIRSRLR